MVLNRITAALRRWAEPHDHTRDALRKRPFPPRWRLLLEARLPLYRRLPAECQPRLHGHMHVFLAEKHFEGCGGLALTDEVRLLIAAQACLLLLNLEGADYFSKLRSILVYPGAVMPRYTSKPMHGELVIEEEEPLLGESWTQGAVILAWDVVRRDAEGAGGGRNVVLHEFAHQLDQEDGISDGTPFLPSEVAAQNWRRVMQTHLDELRRDVEEGRYPLLDPYGAANLAEFFAVATESFFESSAELREEHPALYAELAGYYRLNPAEWPPDAAEPVG